MRRIIRYLVYAFKLLRMNIGTLLAFEILYKFTLAAFFKPVLYGLIKLAMHFAGTEFLSGENLADFLRTPVTWLFLILFVAGMAIVTLFDICCIIVCIHASYRKQKMPLLALMKKGALMSLRVVIQRKNLVLPMYLLIVIPMTHTAVISGYLTKFTVPDIIVDYIYSHWILLALWVIGWVYLGFRAFNWVFALHYFCLEGDNFKQARKKSYALIAGHYVPDLILVVVWCLGMSGAYYLTITGGSLIIAKVNSLLSNYDMFCSLTLSGISLLMEIVGGFFYCFSLPLTFLCISLMFYYHKATKKEKIPPALDGLDDAYQITHSKLVKKLLPYKKRLIAIAIAVVIGINFFYLFGEKVGFLEFGTGHNTEVTAHRGYSAEYPENTMLAFKGAIEIGADWIELDVQETKDGVLIVTHDSNLKRVTGQDLNVWETNWSDIENLDAGSWFDPSFKEIHIPTLEQVLDTCGGKIKINIELKPSGNESADFEKNVVDLINKYHLSNMCIISSLTYDCLTKVKAVDSDITTAYITSLSYGNYSVLEAADIYSIEVTNASASFISEAHKNGKEVHVWTVNDETKISKVVEAGADNVITDNPVAAEKIVFESTHVKLVDSYINKLLDLRD